MSDEMVCKLVNGKTGLPWEVLQGRRGLSIAARATTRVAQGRDEPCRPRRNAQGTRKIH